MPGIGLGDESYPRPEVSFALRTRDLQLLAIASQLEDQQDSLGQLVHRYFFAHRLGFRLSRRLQAALWETTVLAGHERDFDARYRNPLTLGVLANLYGFADRGNILVGADVRWRVRDALAIEAQVALDDIANRASAEGHPSRYAFTVGAHGPVGGGMGWRALYTQASSLAFRTFNPQENLTDSGVGLGRNFDDNDEITLVVTLPVRRRWLVSPELTLLRQGEGRIDDPYPGTRAERLATPALFIGTVERTWRAALSVSGQEVRSGSRRAAGIITSRTSRTGPARATTASRAGFCSRSGPRGRAGSTEPVPCPGRLHRLKSRSRRSGRLAQLVRARASHARGRGFDPLIAHCRTERPAIACGAFAV